MSTALPDVSAGKLRAALQLIHEKWELGGHCRAPDSQEWVAYVRKSVDDNRDNISLADQEGVIRAWAAKSGYTLHPAVFSDVLSGSAEAGKGPNLRRGLYDALECVQDAKHKRCGLVVYRLDRLSRDTLHTLTILNLLEDSKKNFASASEDQLGFGPIFDPQKEMQSRMMLLFHCIMAETERYNARIRTKASCDQRAKRSLGQSRYSPYGTRFHVTTQDGIIESHDSAILRAREPTLQLTVVPHPGEVEQFERLLSFTVHFIAANDEWPTGTALLQSLRHENMDFNHRKNTTWGRAAVLKKALASYLKYRYTVKGQSVLMSKPLPIILHNLGHSSIKATRFTR